MGIGVFHMGSIPFTCSTSEQSPLCSDVLFYKRTSSACCLVPPFQIEPASLGFDLVKVRALEWGYLFR